MTVKSCCGKPLKRLGKIGRLIYWVCRKCPKVWTQGMGSKRIVLQKEASC